MVDLYKPGFCHLPLAILAVKAKTFDAYNVASYQFPRLKQQLELKQLRPERNAFRNFLGYMAICLGWYCEALCYLNQVLDEDPDNLNALTNLAWLYQSMKRDDWFKEALCDNTKILDEHPADQTALTNLNWLYEMQSDATARMKEIRKSLEDLQLVLNEDGERSRLMRARCLAEKGFAICHGALHENEQIFRDASEMYDKALEIAGDLVTTDESTDWYLGMVRVKKVISSKTWRPDVDFESNFVADAQQVLDNGDDVMKAEVWIKLASLFRNLNRKYEHEIDPTQDHPAFPPVCVRYNRIILECYLSECPELACYKKALEFRPNHAPTLALVAGILKRTYYHTAEDFQHDQFSVFSLLNSSIRADDSVVNRQAFSTKAGALMDYYRSVRKTRRMNRYELLLEAIANYEKSLSMHTEPVDCRQMGDIWLYLAEDYDDGTLSNIVRKTKAECMEKALEYYTIATEIPYGSANPHAHWKRGECLFKMGDLEGAAECYKKGIRQSKSNPIVIHSKLFYTQLKMLDLDRFSRPANKLLAEDAVKWLEIALNDFSTEDVVECVQYHCHSSEFIRRCRFFVDLCYIIGMNHIAAFLKRIV